MPENVLNLHQQILLLEAARNLLVQMGVVIDVPLSPLEVFANLEETANDFESGRVSVKLEGSSDGESA